MHNVFKYMLMVLYCLAGTHTDTVEIQMPFNLINININIALAVCVERIQHKIPNIKCFKGKHENLRELLCRIIVLLGK